MSEYEKINVRVKEQVTSRRTEAIKRIIIVMGKLLLALAGFTGLEAIGFISFTFAVILTAISVCVASFNTGWICRDIKF